MDAPTGLVRLDRLAARWCIGLRYATANNFTGRPLYSRADAWLRVETATKLLCAQEILGAHGVRLMILDAYRPPSAQEAMWSALPDERFVAPPARGSRHTRGTAVDVTLVDGTGSDLEMPSAFDEFGERSRRDWTGASAVARRNVDWLTQAMVDAGFSTISTEWWHFDDADWRRFPLLTWEFAVLPDEVECSGGDRVRAV